MIPNLIPCQQTVETSPHYCLPASMTRYCSSLEHIQVRGSHATRATCSHGNSHDIRHFSKVIYAHFNVK